jgi:2-C-methyl-D-erythritol 4-phosphate cytidylyltransferase/2-C-methyl-D-erythritol 2,4-cyclodiphosphate synthase
MIAALVLASGSGIRLGGPTPKQFLPLGGKPVYRHSLEVFLRHPAVDHTVLVCHPDWIDPVQEELSDLLPPCTIVPGGTSRMESGWNGLRSLDTNTEVVLIHDAARPFVDDALISRLIEAAVRHGAVVPAIPVTDTLIEVKGEQICAMPARERFLRVQTPQVVSYSLIVEAFERARADRIESPTDDSQLVHRLGRPVAWIRGSETNLKITTPADLRLAEEILKTR